MSEKLTVTEEQLEALRAKHGRIRAVDTPAGTIVLRPPSMAEESAFQNAYYGSTLHAGAAYRNLLVTLVVCPEPAQFQQVLAQWPALNMNRDVLFGLKAIRGEVTEEQGK